MIATPAYIFVALSLWQLSLSLPNWLESILLISVVTLLPVLYIVAQAVTVVLAFTSLRALPPTAYETVHWTTFIPHI